MVSLCFILSVGEKSLWFHVIKHGATKIKKIYAVLVSGEARDECGHLDHIIIVFFFLTVIVTPDWRVLDTITVDFFNNLWRQF